MLGRAPAPSGQATEAVRGGGGEIELEEISHVFRTRNAPGVRALTDVTFSVDKGHFLAVVGPSGCGKSTLLNIISGLLMPTSGRVTVKGKPVTQIRHDVGYLPSQDSLLPWRTVVQNVEYPLSLQGVSRAERHQRSRRMLEAVGLGGFEHYYPHALSQGMRQRVAIARLFATDSDLVLMDEPFSALDAQTRVLVQDLFLSIWEKEHRTVVLITHDVSEAVALADRVVVFSSAPGTVLSVHDIDLPRPRSVERLIFDNVVFQEYMRLIWRDLRHDRK